MKHRYLFLYIKSTSRGIYASKNLVKNQILKKDDLILLRPETKLKIEDTSKVIGKKTNKNIYKFDEIKL